MKSFKTLSFIALAVALASMPLAAGPALAKKKAAPEAESQQQTFLFDQKKCPGGVSKGCGPGSCRC